MKNFQSWLTERQETPIRTTGREKLRTAWEVTKGAAKGVAKGTGLGGLAFIDPMIHAHPGVVGSMALYGAVAGGLHAHALHKHNTKLRNLGVQSVKNALKI